ncbi:hypothetical protein WMY93_001022 [Mugilogobius chulae]|uniref:Pentraxin (PTX) domain-containing protein n=1 Tax=Mugilogobius chulae TaxID=88201 RepID=A0AAW0Q112_9GOBI
MEFVCAILFLVLGASAAAPQVCPNLFPTRSRSQQPSKKKVITPTLIIEFFEIPMGLYNGHSQNFFIYNNARFSSYKVDYYSSTSFSSNLYRMNTWQSLCCTWSKQNGLVQLWINGQPHTRKFTSQASFEAPMALVIGEVIEDPPFSRSPFIGMISDVHMWDYEISGVEIGKFSLFHRFIHGNVLNWHRLDFQMHGRMEFVCVILLLVLGTSAAEPQDLDGEMFTFPEESETDFVRVGLSRSNLTSFTVCMRIFSDLLKPHVLFQLSTNSSYHPRNNFVIYNDPRGLCIA